MIAGIRWVSEVIEIAGWFSLGKKFGFVDTERRMLNAFLHGSVDDWPRLQLRVDSHFRAASRPEP